MSSWTSEAGQGMRRMVDRLWDGSPELARRGAAGVGTWIRDGDGWAQRLLRVVAAWVVLALAPAAVGLTVWSTGRWGGALLLSAVIVAGALLVPLLAVALVAVLVCTLWPLAMLFALVGWCASVLEITRTPRDQAAKTPREDADTGPEEDPGEAADEPEIDPLLQVCVDLLGEARGLHLNALVDHLNAGDPATPYTVKSVRSQLAELGVNTRLSVRAPKGAKRGAKEGVNKGLYREDLEAVLGTLPDPAPKTPA